MDSAGASIMLNSKSLSFIFISGPCFLQVNFAICPDFEQG